MFAINSYNPRFNRERKNKIARRARERFKNFGVQPKPTVSQPELRQKEASA